MPKPLMDDPAGKKPKQLPCPQSWLSYDAASSPKVYRQFVSKHVALQCTASGHVTSVHESAAHALSTQLSTAQCSS